MNRNEILTLCCLLLLMATDAALIYAALAAKSKVEALRRKINAVTSHFGVTI